MADDLQLRVDAILSAAKNLRWDPWSRPSKHERLICRDCYSDLRGS